MVICEDKKCFGCAACHDICPQQAIEMSDDTGFWRPVVDDHKCVNCGLCKKVCTSLLDNIKNSVPLRSFPEKCYAAWSKDEETHFNSASGGIATEIAKKFIQNGGIVGGVRFNPDRMCAEHVIVRNRDELKCIAKSKYVLSNKTGIYKSFSKELDKGISALFIGTGCEVNSLYHYLSTKRINTEKLYTIDLLCRGGSSSKCLKEHVNFIRKGKTISDVRFRGGKFDCAFTVWDKNEKLLYKSSQYKDAYFGLFMKHTLFQRHCYECPFASAERTGDITLADFWGLDEKIAERSQMRGINLVILNSDKGKKLFSDIENQLTCYERPLKEAIAGNDTLKEPTEWHEEYDKLWESIITEGFIKAIKKVYNIDETRDYLKFKFYTTRYKAKEKLMKLICTNMGG